MATALSTSASTSLFKHQSETVDFLTTHPRALILSDAGTGKTRAVLEAWARLNQEYDDLGRLLVIAPLSILKPAWVNDCSHWTPHLSISVAYNDCRMEAFGQNTNIVCINHDGVKWLAENQHVLGAFNGLCIDEFTAFKNPNSDRSNKLRELRHYFPIRWLMSGTPTPNSVTDIWFPGFVCDDGDRMGKAFSLFRNQVCDAEPIPGVAFGKKWVDKPNAQDMIGERLRDISLRHRLEDCIDMPERHEYHHYVELNDTTRRYYNDMLRESVLELDETDIEAVHAGARTQKLLQICSGAVYDEFGTPHVLDTSRYELVADMAEVRQHSLIAFMWQHQKDAIAKALKKRGLSYAIIDGNTAHNDRTQAVADFQAGKLRVILAHPQSAGHGLTLTQGRTIIWASPTYNVEHFAQFNARIYRAGQKQTTEFILVTASDTLEETVYQKLNDKSLRMTDLLHLLKQLYETRKTP